MTKTLFIKEKKIAIKDKNKKIIRWEDEKVQDLLGRIMKFLEVYNETYNTIPDCIQISKKDYYRILKYNNTLIDNNRILGMKIVRY